MVLKADVTEFSSVMSHSTVVTWEGDVLSKVEVRTEETRDDSKGA